MSTQTSSTQSYSANAAWNQSSVGTCFPFDAINQPGAYICNWSGHLLRVPDDGITPGRSPLVNIVGPEPLMVTKISDNPYITLTKAKLVASNFDLSVNFEFSAHRRPSPVRRPPAWRTRAHRAADEPGAVRRRPPGGV